MTNTLLSSRRELLLGLGAALALPSPALAQADEDGSLARRLVDVINDPAANEASLSAVLSSGALAKRPAATWLQEFAKLRAASGGLTFTGVRPGQKDERLIAATTRGGRVASLTAFVRADAPGRYSGLFALPRPAPYPGTLPNGALSRRALIDALDRRVRWSARRGDFSGAVRVVAPDGTVAYEAAYGESAGRRIAPGDRFHLGSADKSFTALLVARQVERGRLTWDTRLIDVLPDYANRAAAQAITIGHLVTHRAGLGGLFERPGWQKDRRYERVTELLPVFAAEAPKFAPGSRAAYSNEGFVVLGAVLEAVDGRPYWDQLAAHVFAPAGMIRSAHLTAAQNPPDKVYGERFADDDDLGLRPRVSARDFTGWRGNSCGGGYSTTADMCRYLTALRAGRLASATMTRTLTTPFAGGLDEYGMGFQVQRIGGRTFVGHAGGGPHSGIDGDSKIAWETGWALSVLGNYDAPFAGALSYDLKTILAAQPA